MRGWRSPGRSRELTLGPLRFDSLLRARVSGLLTRFHLQCETCRLDGYGWTTREAERDLQHTEMECRERAAQLERWRSVGLRIARRRRERIASEKNAVWLADDHFAPGQSVVQFDRHEEWHVVLTELPAPPASYRHASASCEPCARSLALIRAEHRILHQWEGWRWRFDQDGEWLHAHRHVKPRWLERGHFADGDRVTYNWPGLAVEIELPLTLPAELLPMEVAGDLDRTNMRHVGPGCSACTASVRILRERRRLRSFMSSTMAGLEAELADFTEA